MSNQQGPSKTCLGTRTIQVVQTSQNLNASSTGLLAAFLDSSNETNDELEVMVMMNGSDTYQNRIPTLHVKGSTNGQPEKLAEALLSKQHPNNGMSVTYTMETQDCLKLSIKEKNTSTGLVRVLWSGPLQLVQDTMTLPMTLGTCVNALRWDYQELQTKHHTAQEQFQTSHKQLQEELRLSTKATHEIESICQDEKDQQLERFLILYKETKHKVTQARNQVKQLELKIEKLKETSQKPNKRQEPNNVFPHVEHVVAYNDQDIDETEPYSADLVDRLAKSPTRKKKPLAKHQEDIRTSKSNQVRRNPLNGAIEIFNAKGIFEDDENDDDNNDHDQDENKKTSPISKKRKHPSSSNDDNTSRDASPETNGNKSIRSNPTEPTSSKLRCSDDGNDGQNENKETAPISKKRKRPSSSNENDFDHKSGDASSETRKLLSNPTETAFKKPRSSDDDSSDAPSKSKKRPAIFRKKRKSAYDSDSDSDF